MTKVSRVWLVRPDNIHRVKVGIDTENCGFEMEVVENGIEFRKDGFAPVVKPWMQIMKYEPALPYTYVSSDKIFKAGDTNAIVSSSVLSERKMDPTNMPEAIEEAHKPTPKKKKTKKKKRGKGL